MTTSRAVGTMGEVLMMVWGSRGDREELVDTRMGEIGRQEVEIWVDVGREYMEGVVNDRSDGSTIQWSALLLGATPTKRRTSPTEGGTTPRGGDACPM